MTKPTLCEAYAYPHRYVLGVCVLGHTLTRIGTPYTQLVISEDERVAYITARFFSSL